MSREPAARVLISTSSFGAVSRRPLELLESAGIAYATNPHGRTLEPTETARLLTGMHGLIAGTERLSREVLTVAPQLRVISRCGVGLDNVDLQAAAERGIRVYHTSEAHVDAVAELALAGMLAVLRHVCAADRGVRAGRWHKPMGSVLRDKIVGVVGVGRVGRRLVQLLAPFDVVILAHDERPDPALTASGIRYVTLDELLAAADVVTLHIPYTDATHDILNRRRLSLMKPTAVLINTARGGLVDEAALCELLEAGKLRGAYLDTFAREPYEGPLGRLDNVVLTPHMGGYATECRARMELEAVENMLHAFHQIGILQ